LLQAQRVTFEYESLFQEEFRNGWGVLELIRLPCFQNVALQTAEFVPDIGGVVDI
jgi:hypothetical protein